MLLLRSVLSYISLAVVAVSCLCRTTCRHAHPNTSSLHLCSTTGCRPLDVTHSSCHGSDAVPALAPVSRAWSRPAACRPSCLGLHVCPTSRTPNGCVALGLLRLRRSRGQQDRPQPSDWRPNLKCRVDAAPAWLYLQARFGSRRLSSGYARGACVLCGRCLRMSLLPRRRDPPARILKLITLQDVPSAGVGRNRGPPHHE